MTACAMIRWRCCGSASIRSSPDTKTPRKPTGCATIRCCRSSPIRNSDTHRLSAYPQSLGKRSFCPRSGTPERRPAGSVPPSPARLCLQFEQPFLSAAAAARAFSADQNPADTANQTRCTHPPDRPLHSHPPRHRLAVSISVPRCRARL